MKSEIIIHHEKCTGCRTCEVICSYHHARVFSRKMGSIRVFRDEKNGKMVPIIHRREAKGFRACDKCKNEKEILCVKHCAAKALVL